MLVARYVNTYLSQFEGFTKRKVNARVFLLQYAAIYMQVQGFLPVKEQNLPSVKHRLGDSKCGEF